MRTRAAIVMAAVYAFCLMFPPVSFAFANGELAIHCLRVTAGNHRAPAPDHDHRQAQHPGDHHHGDQNRGVAHMHADGAPHDHAAMHQDVGLSDHSASHHQDDDAGLPNGNDSTPINHVGACCGLFCAVAVAAQLQSVGRPDIFASAVVLGCEDSLAGRGPDRIDRPPSTTLMSS